MAVEGCWQTTTTLTWCLVVLSISQAVTSNPDTKCFPNVGIRSIPPGHVFHKIKRPIVIGHRGNIYKYQENTVEGLMNLIDLGVKGVHMDVRLTKDGRAILFYEDNLKRMTSENFLVTRLPYSEIAKMRLVKRVKYSASNTISYSSSLQIPLLEDALEKIRGKDILIYVEMSPSNIPPVSPRDRYLSLLTGQKIAEIIKAMEMEDQVILVSRDPFKLVSALYTNPKLVVDWWFGEEIFTPRIGDRMRKEFIDLPGLRTCYSKTAPLSAEKFAEFVVESGVVSKSVNTSLVDFDFDIFNNPIYFSGRTTKTMDLVKQNYNKEATFGAFDVFRADAGNFSEAYKKKLEDLIKAGLTRIVTDDVKKATVILKRALQTGGANTQPTPVFSLLVCVFCVLLRSAF